MLPPLICFCFFLIVCTGTWADDATLQRIHQNLLKTHSQLHFQQHHHQIDDVWDWDSDGHVQELRFQQRLDHFDPLDHRTFSQRVYINPHFLSSSSSSDSQANPTSPPPIFLYVGGEAELRPSSASRGSIIDLARAHTGLIVALEHRYYGVSHPFGNLSTSNLRYLSSAQALADLAYFIQRAPEFLRQTTTPSLAPTATAHHSDPASTGVRSNVDLSESKWVIVGGSYPGNMAAWFRLKFPHLVTGAWASSAPVLAKSNYWEYDETVRQQLGPQCASMVRQATRWLEHVIQGGNRTVVEQVKRGFHEEMEGVVDDVAFLYVLADVVAYVVQYDNPGVGLRDRLCSTASSSASSSSSSASSSHLLLPMAGDVSDPTSGAEAAEKFAHFTRFFFDYTHSTPLEMDMTSYTRTDIRDPSENQRQWMWQCCTEFGYWQTAPTFNSLRSTMIDEQWHLDRICTGLYGLPSSHRVPMNETNAVYGALSVVNATDRIIFTNGNRDPWKRLSIQEDETNRRCQAYWIDGVGHCADLKSAGSDDPLSLTQVRDRVMQEIASWLRPSLTNDE